MIKIYKVGKKMKMRIKTKKMAKMRNMEDDDDGRIQEFGGVM